MTHFLWYRFAEKLRVLALDGQKRFPGFVYDVEGDIETYKEVARRVLPFVGDTVDYINAAWESGARFLWDTLLF